MLTRRSFLAFVPALYAFAKSQVLRTGRREFHVAAHGNDAHDGGVSHPLRTISAAAVRAQAGDVITVHEGVYRERISPPRGGTSDANRIVYQAAPGEHVVISGAEVLNGWVRLQGDTWKATIANQVFGGFNPYNDVIHGDWFNPNGRVHHTGAVYLNGDWLAEAAKLDDVFRETDGTPLWFGDAGNDTTTLWAQFRGMDPNEQQTEINVRQTVFYPETTGVDYITVRGFILRQAATPWAPPTAEQIGVIGTHWSKGWIIENNQVSYSTCSGIALGKYGDQWDNTSANSAEGYVKTIKRASAAGWSKETIGHHTVRNNTVSHCEQAGIVGSLGPVFSVVTGNTIHDIYVRQLFSGAEIAGIKFHAAIDVEISHNRIYRSCRGLWLDWMAQGTRVSGNLFHDNQLEDVMIEVDHGPFVVDNNLFLSKTSQRVISQGGAYLHNLFCGGVSFVQHDDRKTPFMKPHSTDVAGYHDNPSGDMRFFNNLFAQGGDLTPFNEAQLPMQLAGNLFLKGAKPCSQESAPLLKPEFDPDIQLVESSQGVQLVMMLDHAWIAEQKREFVTSALLGLAAIPNLPFERPDGTAIRIENDYSGQPRNRSNPCPGPFEYSSGGTHIWSIWPTRT